MYVVELHVPGSICPARQPDMTDGQATPLRVDDGVPYYAPILLLVVVVACAQLNCIIERHRFGDANARRSA